MDLKLVLGVRKIHGQAGAPCMTAKWFSRRSWRCCLGGDFKRVSSDIKAIKKSKNFRVASFFSSWCLLKSPVVKVYRASFYA